MKRLILLLSLLLFFSFPTFSQSAQERLIQADHLFQEGKVNEAVEIYQTLLSHVGFQRQKEFGKALYWVALLEPMPQIALGYLEKYLPAVEHPEYQFELIFLLAIHYDLLGETLSALKHYQKAIAIYDKAPLPSQKTLYLKARFFSATLLAQMGQTQEAKVASLAIIKEDADPSFTVQAVLLQSRLLVEEGKIEEGIEAVQALFRQNEFRSSPLFRYWCNFLIDHYPLQTTILKDSYERLKKSEGDYPLAEAIPTLSMILSDLKNSSMVPLNTQEIAEKEESEKEISSVSVEQQAPPKALPKETLQPAKNTPPAQKNYWIQVASFSDKENALFYAKELKKKDFPYKITLAKSGVYRVYVIPKAGEDLNLLFLKLKDAGFEGLLVEKK